MKIIGFGRSGSKKIETACKSSGICGGVAGKNKEFFLNFFRGIGKKCLGNNKKTFSFALLAGFFVFAVLFSVAGNLGMINNGRYVAANAGAIVAKGGRTVVIDAGHGGMDGGAVGATGVIEKGINLAVAKNLKAMLEFSGYTVIMTREDDRSIHDTDVHGIAAQKKSDMANRKKIIDSYPDSVFVSIHQNRFTDPAYFGGQMFYMEGNPLNKAFAEIVQGKFAALQQGNDREVKISDGMFLLRGAKQPAILAECGFLSNPNDEAKLNDAEYQQKVAFALFCGITEFFDTVNSGTGGAGNTGAPLITGSGIAGNAGGIDSTVTSFASADIAEYDGGYMGMNYNERQ